MTRNKGGEEELSFGSQFEGIQSRAGEGIAVGSCLETVTLCGSQEAGERVQEGSGSRL